MSSKKKSAPKKTTTSKGTVSANQENYAKFVQVWNSAVSVQEVVEKMGMTKTKVAAWSMGLRKRGVALKRFRSSFQVDVDALNAIAEKALR